MKGYNESYCNASLNAIMSANNNLMMTTVKGALKVSHYGKTDTLALDSIPEIAISRILHTYDPDCILVTEELGCDAAKVWPAYCNPKNQPTIFFCDPTDRSYFLKKFLEDYLEKNEDTEIEKIIAKANKEAAKPTKTEPVKKT